MYNVTISHIATSNHTTAGYTATDIMYSMNIIMTCVHAYVFRSHFQNKEKIMKIRDAPDTESKSVCSQIWPHLSTQIWRRLGHECQICKLCQIYVCILIHMTLFHLKMAKTAVIQQPSQTVSTKVHTITIVFNSNIQKITETWRCTEYQQNGEGQHSMVTRKLKDELPPMCTRSGNPTTKCGAPIITHGTELRWS